LGGEFGASRALVDLGRADYPEQVGLTGRMVAPKVYLAIGISGAVQHAVGFRDADTVIAVNPDEGAPIFGCADYGIVSTFRELYEAVCAEIKK
ncbi:MAG: electron transfer flavoprotein subunit alpha/FixB family protein, partial [Clostridia bacterium]|nr:electron transfer flavoprotein subunit alpha/FixB family protein [Clostridia bacterium]